MAISRNSLDLLNQNCANVSFYTISTIVPNFKRIGGVVNKWQQIFQFYMESPYNACLFTGFQHKECTVGWVQAECMGHRWTEEDQTLLEELLRKHRRPCKCHTSFFHSHKHNNLYIAIFPGILLSRETMVCAAEFINWIKINQWLYINK